MPMIPTRGRPAVPISFEFLRPLQLEDLLRVASGTDLPYVSVQAPKRLREIHHRIAELVASGMSNVEVGRNIGCTPNRVAQLKDDPAFCNLVAYFSDQIHESTIDIRAKVEAQVIDISELALDEIQGRLETDATKIPLSELRQIASMGLDRTILPPKPAQTTPPAAMNVTFNMGTRDLRNGTIVEVEATEVPSEVPEPELEKESKS